MWTEKRFRVTVNYGIADTVLSIWSGVFRKNGSVLKRLRICFYLVSCRMLRNFRPLNVSWMPAGHCRQTLHGMLLWRRRVKILWIRWQRVCWLWHPTMRIWRIRRSVMCCASAFSWSGFFRCFRFMDIMPIITMNVGTVFIFIVRMRICRLQRIFFWCFVRIRSTRSWKPVSWILHWYCIWNTAAVITPLLRPVL